jgi:hypothetical protein
LVVPIINLVIRYNTAVVVVRRTSSGDTRIDMKAVVDSGKIFLPVDADIEEGDRVEQQLPNGKTRTIIITKVDVLQSPFGSGVLDHTEAEYTTSTAQSKRMDQDRRSPRVGPTFNVRANNVQVATGDRSRQTMTVGQTSEQLVLVIQGIVEILEAFGLTSGRESELAEAQQDAVADVTSNEPTAEGVRRFCNWVLGCVRQGATAAAVAAVTAASNGLLHDAETLVRAIGG